MVSDKRLGENAFVFLCPWPTTSVFVVLLLVGLSVGCKEPQKEPQTQDEKYPFEVAKYPFEIARVDVRGDPQFGGGGTWFYKLQVNYNIASNHGPDVHWALAEADGVTPPPACSTSNTRIDNGDANSSFMDLKIGAGATTSFRACVFYTKDGHYTKGFTRTITAPSAPPTPTPTPTYSNFGGR